jgi:recombination protein RecR
MSKAYTHSLQRLIEELCQFPGIGPKSAERIAFYLLASPREKTVKLTQAILQLKDQIRYCKRCWNLSEAEICAICENPQRQHQLVCVVEEPKDIIAIEKSGGFQGVYHVLLGRLSPLENIGPEQLKIKEFLSRLEKEDIQEVIIATNTDTEGETTALYLTKLIKPLNVKVSRIAYGIPFGSNLEYADQATLQKALEGRREI